MDFSARGIHKTCGSAQPKVKDVTSQPGSQFADMRQAVQRCLDAGHALEDVALVTMRGRHSSQLLAQEMLGPWTLRRFTGQYDAAGSPIWTEGELLADTVYRFKGQAADAGGVGGVAEGGGVAGAAGGGEPGARFGRPRAVTPSLEGPPAHPPER